MVALGLIRVRCGLGVILFGLGMGAISDRAIALEPQGRNIQSTAKYPEDHLEAVSTFSFYPSSFNLSALEPITEALPIAQSSPAPVSTPPGMPDSAPAATPQSPDVSPSPVLDSSPNPIPVENQQPDTTRPGKKPDKKSDKKSSDKKQSNQTPADQTLVNPLEITEPDSLIPYDYKERALTVGERRELAAAADRLVLIGAGLLQKGDRVGAFDAWNRELRYRRLIGSLPKEVMALGRVGDVAWQQNDTTELRWITKRLDQILAQTQKVALSDSAPSGQGSSESTFPNQAASDQPTDLKSQILLLEALGVAYQQVRLPKTAASVYEFLLADARDRKDDYRIEAALILLGQLHLSWFNYDDAAKVYTELLARAAARDDRFNEPIYLKQLIYVYDRSKQPDQAILYREKLVAFYQTVNDPKPIPGLKVKIADDYRRLERLDQAEANYQLAYNLAVPQLQFADAGDALRKLGELYRVNNRLESALRMYSFLVGIEQQAYNTYGVMNAYDQLGQIYLLQKDYPQAIAAFQQGLAIARQLKIREDYFTAQIQQATKN